MLLKKSHEKKDTMIDVRSTLIFLAKITAKSEGKNKKNLLISLLKSTHTNIPNKIHTKITRGGGAVACILTNIPDNNTKPNRRRGGGRRGREDESRAEVDEICEECCVARHVQNSSFVKCWLMKTGSFCYVITLEVGGHARSHTFNPR